VKRGDLYRVRAPRGDPKRSRAFVVVSRPALIASKLSTVICAPVYTRRDGLSTQVDVGAEQGLKHESSIHCDALVSIPKSRLTDYVGALRGRTLRALDEALRIALALE
jgi:mRNA interferase MazF